MHAQYFALLNLILKLQFCGKASLEFPYFNFPEPNSFYQNKPPAMVTCNNLLTPQSTHPTIVSEELMRLSQILVVQDDDEGPHGPHQEVTDPQQQGQGTPINCVIKQVLSSVLYIYSPVKEILYLPAC